MQVGGQALHNDRMSQLVDLDRPFIRAGRMAMPRGGRVAVLATLLSSLPLCMTACAPALNWRDVHPAQADGLKALFPCKPATHEREVPWPGLPQGVVMRMLSCQTDEATWALSYVTVPDVALVGPSLHEMAMMLRRNLAAASQMAAQTVVGTPASGPAPGRDAASGADAGGNGQSTAVLGLSEQDLGPISVPGMTPMPQAHAWRFTAQRPDGLGRPLDLDIRTWHFSHGMTVFQASVWRPASAAKAQSSEDVAQAFFGGLQFPL
jgi:hypothetical protein